jgi:hypothetical protein
MFDFNEHKKFHRPILNGSLIIESVEKCKMAVARHVALYLALLQGVT